MTAPTEAGPAADPTDSTDHGQQAPSSGDTCATAASRGAQSDSATDSGVAAGWAAVDTWGGARTRSGRFARSPDKGAASSGTDDAAETAAPAVVGDGATAAVLASRAEPRQTKAVVPPLWQAAVRPAEGTTAVVPPPACDGMYNVRGEMRRAEGQIQAESGATGQRTPTVDGWVARPARSKPADPRPLIPRVATLALGPSPAALARVAAKPSKQPPRSGSASQTGGPTSRPASGSVMKSPAAPWPPEFPGFSSPTRPRGPAAAVAYAAEHPVSAFARPAAQSPPSALRPKAAAASSANGAPLAGRSECQLGPAAVNSAPDSAAKFGYVYAPPAPRAPRGLPRSPVRGMSSLDASGLRPVATVPVRADSRLLAI